MLSHFPDHELLALIRKSLAGTATEEEESFLANYYNHLDKRADVLAQMSTEEKDLLEEQMKTAIFQRIEEAPPAKVIKIRRPVWRIAASVAAVALLVISITYFLIYPSKDPTATSVKNQPPMLANDVLPGGNKATLTLADGSVITLDSAKNGRLADQGRATVLKVDDGQLAYNRVDGEPQEIAFNTVSTPRGGQYRVILADGTQVWLNSLSSILFPTAFTGAERKVEITGEAYFEVAKDKNRPFKVLVNGMEVEALGTQFNINAYTDERNITTTLVEGSVRVKKGNANVLLFPDNQAILNGNNELDLLPKVNTEEIIAWKNGWFQFEGTSIESIMRQVSRWYDVEVIFEKKVDKYFVATIPRNVPVSRLLRIFELTESVHFKIEGKTITVMP